MLRCISKKPKFGVNSKVISANPEINAFKITLKIDFKFSSDVKNIKLV